MKEIDCQVHPALKGCRLKEIFYNSHGITSFWVLTVTSYWDKARIPEWNFESTIILITSCLTCNCSHLVLIPQYLPLSIHFTGFPGGTMIKNLPARAGDRRDAGLIPGSGRSPEEGNGSPLQYACLEHSIDRGGWQAPVHEVTKSQTQPSDWAHSMCRTHIHSNQSDICEMQTGCISSA